MMYKITQMKGGLGWHEYTREAILSEEEVTSMGFLDEGIKREIEEYGGATIEGANKYTIITEVKE